MTKVAVPPLKRGLDIPLAGVPENRIVDGPALTQVGLIADDYVGMKPTMHVTEGDRVKFGQLLFEDKKTKGVNYTSPAAGKVLAVNRGAKRKFESIVIEVDGEDAQTFESYENTNLHSLDRDKTKANLLAAGVWPALRTRPYSRVPSPESSPKSIFVTAIDTNPLAPDPALVLNEPDYERYFSQGLQVLTTLSDGDVFLCKAPGAEIPGDQLGGVEVAEFGGPHPAGLPGTHIHFLDPVNENKTVWYIGYQDVVAIGKLFVTGQLMNDRVISVAGPGIMRPEIIRTQVGAAVKDLTNDKLAIDNVRIISGSVLSGRKIVAPVDFLGRYHNQISVIEHSEKRDFLGWAMPGRDRFSVSKAFLSGFIKPEGRLPFTTSSQGSKRAIVPIGMFESVMPLDIVATPLLKSLVVQDTETAQMLGCLELDEEDLALCTFVCPGKNEYGPLLRQCLTHIEKEG